MSASIPYVFRPVPLVNPATGDTALLVDGALASKFPVELVAQADRPILGFRFAEASEVHPHTRIAGPVSLTAAVTVSGMRARDSLPSGRFSDVLIVSVPADHDPLDFSISPEKVEGLFEGGYRAASDILADIDLRPRSQPSEIRQLS